MLDKTYCGFIAILGRPNVGKSTLLNSILNKKISITSHKPQTTRCQVLGVKTIENKQMVWIDTPGLHNNAKKALNRYMNQSAKKALIDVNAIVFVIEALHWTQEDESVFRLIQKHKAPLIIAVNKIDKVKDKDQLLPYLKELATKAPTAEIIPMSALEHQQVRDLEQSLLNKLPQDFFYFPEDSISNHSQNFHMSEIIREKLMIYLEQEVPYSIAVEIEKCEENKTGLLIHALIWVEKEGQKRIVIGNKGEQLKKIGTKARLSLEHYLNQKVCLKLWVKVKANWASRNDILEFLVG